MILNLDEQSRPLAQFAHRGRAILSSASHQATLYRLNGEIYGTFDMFGVLFPFPSLLESADLRGCKWY